MTEDTELRSPVSHRVQAVLIRARHILQRGWCKRTLATDRLGRSTHVADPKAARFCALGALDRASHELREAEGINEFCASYSDWTYARGEAVTLIALQMPAPYGSPTEYNDDPRTTKADVLAWFDRTIAKK